MAGDAPAVRPVRPDREAIAAMWADFRRDRPGLAEQPPMAIVFGDTIAEADALAALVVRGLKRAGAALAAELGRGGDPLPRIGDHGVVCDGSGQPRVVVRTIELRIGAAQSVDEAFARDDLGERDLSRDEWLTVHRQFFEGRCRALGMVYDDDVEVVFERFSVVWPPGTRITG